LIDILIIPLLVIFLHSWTSIELSSFLQQVSIKEAILQVINDSEIRNTYLYFQPIILIAAVFLLLTKKKRNKINELGGPEQAGNGEFGTSRWLSRQEVKTNSTVWKADTETAPQVMRNPYEKKPNKKDTISVGGIVLGMENNNVYLDTEDTNTLTIGTSRSGKSRTLVLPTIFVMAQAGESMIITDPKGELCELTKKHLEEKGYEIIIMNFRDPNKSRHWNPIHNVRKAIKENNVALASQLAWSIARSFTYQSSDVRADVWANGQEAVIAALILAVAIEADSDDEVHLSSVYSNLIENGRTITIPTKPMPTDIVPLNIYFEQLPTDNPAKQAWGTVALSPEKMRGSFFSSAASSLRLFADIGISHITKKQDHNLEDVGNKPTAVFLIIPDEDKTRHILASLYVDQTYQSLVRLANNCGGRIPIRVNNILDEFGNMPAIPDFDNKVTVSLGRGIRWHPIVQDLQQIRKLYDKNSNTITGNCHTWIYLLTTDPETALQISKRTGKYTIEVISHSSNSSDKGSSSGQSHGLTGRELLTPDEILKFPKEQALITRARMNPARLPLPDFTKWSTINYEKTEIDERGDIKQGKLFILPIKQIQKENDNESLEEEYKEYESII
jgi:type IV secretion system protein VirD4